MLQGINRLGKSWVGRVVVAILFGFLIVSFAVWGIGDIFRGGVRTHVATVGTVDVPAEAYRTAYQTEYQNLIRRTRQTITPEQARTLGLDRQVLGRLVTESALDQRARELGLAVPDSLVVQAIQNDPSFKGPSGQFDRGQFFDLLRSNGLSEGQYVRDQKAVAARLQLAESVTGALPVPIALREAVHRFTTERRSVDYATLGPAAAGEIPAPSDAELASFYEDRKALYRAPEYRAVNVLAIGPSTLAKPDAIAEADIRAAYERTKEARFGTPEKRTIQQIVFPSIEEANAAAARIKAGTGFDEIAKERAIDETTLDLGTFAKAEMFDPATAEAAFALPESGVSDAVPGRFGPVIVRVTKVKAGSLRPFDEVAGEVRGELARQRAVGDVQKAHDEIEDQRASAKPLEAIAGERGLTLGRVAGVDRQGRGKAGEVVAGLPEPASVLPVVFRSDVGADTEAVRLPDGGYVWVEVTAVEPARDRPLADVRDRAAADWRSEETARRLTDRARGLRERLDAGEPFPKVAGEAGLKVETAADLGRTTASGELTRPVLTRLFATPVGKAADVATEGGGRILFRVTGATMPPFVTTTQESGRVAEQLRSALADDLLSEYFAQVEKAIGVRTFPDAMRRAIGADS